MKYQTTTKGLIAGLALSAFLGFSINAQAQTCTIDNWDDSNGLANANAGTQGSGNRRYGGPCGLRVPVDGVPRYLVDDSPATESTYIARFYAFLNNAGSEEVILFEDGGSNLQVWYNVPDPGDITLNVVDSASEANFLTVSGAGAGWHSIEFSWESSATANIAFSVNGGSDLTDTIDTSGITLSSVRLGNVNGVSGPGSIDFDDFDSRRISRPGRLMVGDANGDGNINFFDLFELNNEIAGGGFFAAGQPDCNEDGEINFFDLFCLNNQL
jgi:hypothetical protein